MKKSPEKKMNKRIRMKWSANGKERRKLMKKSKKTR